MSAAEETSALAGGHDWTDRRATAEFSSTWWIENQQGEEFSRMTPAKRHQLLEIAAQASSGGEIIGLIGELKEKYWTRSMRDALHRGLIEIQKDTYWDAPVGLVVAADRRTLRLTRQFLAMLEKRARIANGDSDKGVTD